MADKLPWCVCERNNLLQEVLAKLLDGEDSAEGWLATLTAVSKKEDIIVCTLNQKEQLVYYYDEIQHCH